MILSLIAAVGKKMELGKDNQLLWKLPADMKHFKETTSGHTVIMGRKTFESIGRPLPNRKNIVVTRDATYMRDGIEVTHSLDEALQIASLEQGKKFEENQDEVEVFVIGGGELYAQALPRAQRLYMTHVDAELPADTFFPEINGNAWKQVSSESHSSDEQNSFAYTFTLWEKK